MRHFPILITSLAFLLAACSGGDDDDSAGGTGGDAGAGGDTSAGGGGTGGVGSGQVEFADLPGKIRFVNFVSDGTAGVDLDLYWGTSIARSERVGVVEYGEITEYFTPRRLSDSILDPDEARYFMVPSGDLSGTPASFLVQDDPSFAADTVLTVALAATDNALVDGLAVAVQTLQEAELSTPPAGMAHVFGWSTPFEQIENGDFVLVGADGLCNPERGDPGGANLGAPALIPERSAGLALFDANTDPPCATGSTPVAESVEAGHSYVLLGEAETYDFDARNTVLLELGTEN